MSLLYSILFEHMKNFKKLFASLAIVAMLASTVPTAVLGTGSYSDELEGAYDYAYGIGITTQSNLILQTCMDLLSDLTWQK